MNRLPSLVVVGLMAALFLGLPGSAGAGPRHCGNTTHTDWTIVDTEAGPTAVGTDGDDVFLAWHVDGSEDMHVFGLGGDDVICAGSGDNVLSGGPGHDIIDGNVGADEIDGGPGDDILIGGDGPDLMDGRDGDDILWGAADSDSMYGGPGADDISDDGTDVVHADDVSGEPPEPPVTEPAAPRAALPPLDEPLAPTPKPTTTPAPPTPTPIPTVAPAPDPTPTPALEPAPPTPTVTAAPDPTPPAAPPPTDGVFTVVGRQILDPNGEVFYPIGANAGPPLRDTNGACVWWVSLRCSDMTGRSGNVLAWNWNTLRVNLMCQDVNLGNGQRHGPTEMFAAIDRMVDEYTSAGIVLLLECHDTLAANPPVGGDMWNDIAAFWTEAIARYGDNPYIWINFGNEFEARNDPDYWRAFTEAAYAHLRDAGYRGPMVMDLPNWAQHIQFFEDPANVEWSRQFDQVVWGWHAYGGVSEDGSVLGVQPDLSIEAMGVLYDRILANLAANEIPVLVGEFGYDWNTERRIDDGWSWISMRNSALLNMERLYDAGIGMTLWHANGSAGTFMHMGVKASDDLTFDEPTVDANLSELGEVYWQLSRRIGADRAG